MDMTPICCVNMDISVLRRDLDSHLLLLLLLLLKLLLLPSLLLLPKKHALEMITLGSGQSRWWCCPHHRHR